MKKYSIILFCIFIFLFPHRVHAQKNINYELLKEALIESMLDEITEAVSDKGTGRLWYRGNEKILDIHRPDPHTVTSYTVTIQVLTFSGAHNPPYAYETMTFTLPDKKLIKYDVRWEKN